jgi:hypothetical protein
MVVARLARRVNTGRSVFRRALTGRALPPSIRSSILGRSRYPLAPDGFHDASSPAVKIAPAGVAPVAPTRSPLNTIALEDIEEKPRTLFIYMAANTHLDPYAHQCFTEMCGARVPKGMNVVMLITGGEFDKSDPVGWPNRSRLVWLPPSGSPRDAAYEVALDVEKTRLGKELASSPTLQMHTGPAFTAAMDTVRRAWPKTDFTLALWSDGGETQAIEDDDLSHHGKLMPASSPALKEGLQTLNPSLIIHDLCRALNLSLQTAEADAVPGALSVACESPESSWHWGKALNTLSDMEDQGTPLTAKGIGRVFVEQYGIQGAMVELNLSDFPRLDQVAENFFGALNAQGGLGNSTIQAAYEKLWRLGNDGSADLAMFAEGIKAAWQKDHGSSDGVVQSADQVLDQLKEMGFTLANDGQWESTVGVYLPPSIHKHLPPGLRPYLKQFLQTAPPA